MQYNTDVPSFCPDFSDFPNYNSVSGQALDDDKRRLEERGGGKGRPSVPPCLLLHNSSNSYFEVGNSLTLLYDQDIVVRKFNIHPSPETHERSRRKAIFEFSDKSRRSLLFTSRNSGHHIKSHVCLTFHNMSPINGIAFKELLNIFLNSMRKSFPDLHYLWVLEFHKSGVPHAHFFSNIDPVLENRQKVASLWVRTVDGSQANYVHTAHPENFFPWVMTSGSYLAKEYISKSIQKDVPEHFHSVGRFWGCSKNMIPRFVVMTAEMIGKEIYTKAVRIALKLYEKKVEKFTILKHGFKRLNFRRNNRSRSVPNMAKNFITLVKHYWFYGIGVTGVDHEPFDPLRCPSFEYGVSF